MPPILGEFNFSIAAIPAYYMITFACHSYAMARLVKHDKEWKAYDNLNPRTATPEALRKVMGPAEYETFTRAKGAHNNGHENFPLFAAAVLAGNFAGLNPKALNLAAAAVLVQRVLYTIVYIAANTRRQSFIRTFLWFTQTATNFYILAKAAMVWDYGSRK